MIIASIKQRKRKSLQIENIKSTLSANTIKNEYELKKITIYRTYVIKNGRKKNSML
jgi:hypothetical protein